MTSFQPLDRPAWSALTTRQAKFSQGDARALRFAPEFAPFVAAADTSPESLVALAMLVPADEGMVILEAGEISAPPGALIATRALCHQMVAEQLTPGVPVAFTIEPLTAADAPEMLALATLTSRVHLPPARTNWAISSA